ncbi:MAG: aromatic-ring-hydroxylating dioxygenase subunit beta [Pigmentiphaga sp.]|nr:aromatic-ring-hydroxylating dioxygenase subunit beta [Pigmentiphaga sp.]
MSDDLVQKVSQFVTYEAECLDHQRWDEWLSLMDENIQYWVPAWHSESELTNNPRRELSLMYYDSRQGLEDRVFRIRSGRSVASNPMPRTCHFVTNVRAQMQADGSCHAVANWQTLSWRNKKTSTYYGFYDYVLTATEGVLGWRIQRKKITVLNSLIENVLDVYLI